ncbi:MAG: LysR family transcriptional regulator [Pseudomonadota bacterium]
MFDLSTLRTFTLVAEHLNFTTVADLRNTVQSAVGAQIKKLEDSTGQTLVSRGRGRHMQLTPEGKVFLVYAHRILALSQEAVDAVDNASSLAKLRLGTTVTLAMSVVSEVLSAFVERHGHVQIEIECARSDALLGLLDNGDIDAAFMIDQGRRRGRSFVYSQALVWVGSEGLDLPEGSQVPLAFLSDGRDLRHYALAALDKAGRTGRICHASRHPIGVRAFAQSGLAVTVMPEVSVKPPLAIVPKSAGLPPLPPLALSAYAREDHFAPEISYLFELLEREVN